MLESFFFDGRRLLAEHIPGLIHKLHRLAAIVSRLGGFRFYGCSLLFVYDGDEKVQDQYLAAKQAMATHDREDVHLTGPLQDDARPSRSNKKHHHHHHHQANQQHHDKKDYPPPRRCRSADDRRTEQNAEALESRRKRGQVRIRVVDFAHPTTGSDFAPADPHEDTSGLGKGYDAPIDPASGKPRARFPPKHPQDPDMGFLFGLKSICNALKEIYEHECDRRREAAIVESSNSNNKSEPVEGMGRVDKTILPALAPCPDEQVFESLFPTGFDTSYLST